MSKFSFPKFLEVLPDNFKTKYPGTISNSSDIENLIPDPVALSAYMMDILNEDMRFYVDTTLEEFYRTRRISEVVISTGIRFNDLEVYKGYLSFKGTRNDIEYFKKQIDLDISLNQRVLSRLIDAGQHKPVLINNTSPWKITNPNNTIIITQDISKADLTDSCVFDAVVSTSGDPEFLVSLYDKLNTLIYNRLASFAFIGDLITKIHLNDTVIDDVVDNFGNQLNIKIASERVFSKYIDNTSPWKMGSGLIIGDNIAESVVVSGGGYDISPEDLDNLAMAETRYTSSVLNLYSVLRSLR